MSVLYTPRRPRRLRLHKSIPRGRRLRRIRPAGSLGNIYATGFGSLTWRRLEAGRRLLTRQLRRSKVRVRTRLSQPLTAKSKNARMGKGKGKLRGWTGYARPGTLMYVVEPTPRKSWRNHRSPITRLLGLFPFGRLNYKYSGGMAAVQRSGLAPWGEGNRRPRPHYPQRQRPCRLTPAHRSSRFFGPLNPWQRARSYTVGLGLWLGRCGGEITSPLRQLLLSGGEDLLRGFLVGRRRAEHPPLAGEGILQRLLLRRQQQHRYRHRRRLILKLLKRLPQHWRSKRKALGSLLEAWWKQLEKTNQRRLKSETPYQGLLLTLQQLMLLGKRLQRLQQQQQQGFGAALPLLPRRVDSDHLWPAVEGLQLYQLERRRQRLRRRRRLPLTSIYPTTLPLGMETPLVERPERLTPGVRRRWLRRNWFIGWTVRNLRQQRSFPTLADNLYPTPELRFIAAETTGGVEITGHSQPNTGGNPLLRAKGGPETPEVTKAEEIVATVAETPSPADGEKPQDPETPAPRRWRRTLSPEEQLQQQLLNQELLDQQLLEAEENQPMTASGSYEFINLEPATLPKLGRLREWRQKTYRSHSPEGWAALQRRLASPPAQQLLEERRGDLMAASRLGGWLARGDSASALLQQHQWQQKLALWGLTLGWHHPSGALALGTPTGGALSLGMLMPLLQRLQRRRVGLVHGFRRRQRRGRRLRRRNRRLRRIKARRRRFWRLTHRRRWYWWHRRSRRRSWRWNPRLVVR